MCTKHFLGDFYVRFGGFSQHEVHVDKDFVRILFLCHVFDSGPELLSSHVYLRNETPLLKVAAG